MKGKQLRAALYANQHFRRWGGKRKCNPTPLIEAHRGDSANAPENTLAAFARALASAVPSIELDVHPARDGTLMVIHDDTVDRTSDGAGAVGDMTVDELRRLDVGAKFGPAFIGERIPQLSEVLKLVAPTPAQLNVEIKVSPAGTNVPRAVARLLRRFGKQGEYIVSSFDLSCLLRVRALDPEITLALIGNGPEVLARARQHGLPWINCNHRTVDKELVARAHRQGIRVSVWTVDDPKTLPVWRRMGVDKICTNLPALMLRQQRQESRRSARRTRCRRRRVAPRIGSRL
ncbi:MAG: glycerophosphodiester phosphodiesterase [Desulfuromonadales bacterium]